MLRIEYINKNFYNTDELKGIMCDLSSSQVSAVFHSIQCSDYLYVVKKGTDVVALVGYEELSPYIAYLGVFYVFKRYRKSKVTVEVIKLTSEKLLKYSTVRYTPLVGSNLPIRYCKRRTIDIQKAYKDTHG